ncbi:MAG: DUF2846 domain-containing protein [Betaproteobacteria bacterium]|nr:DUF2846 domain-containing protein [Betaproteobacteria bacterium]
MEADSTAKRFLPRKGYSHIYLYRHETLGGAFAMTVSLDGKVIGKTGPQTYLMWEVTPGKHEIASHTENTARITVQAKEGRNHYVWQEVKMGMWQPRSQLQEMNEEEGKKGVLECKRAAEGD